MSLLLGIVLVVVFALGVIAKVAIGLATNEVKGWIPHASRSLVHRAVEQLPPGERDRWEEEGLADVEAHADRPISGLLHAANMLHRARLLADELTAEPEADRVASAPTALISFGTAVAAYRAAVEVRRRTRANVDRLLLVSICGLGLAAVALTTSDPALQIVSGIALSLVMVFAMHLYSAVVQDRRR